MQQKRRLRLLRSAHAVSSWKTNKEKKKSVYNFFYVCCIARLQVVWLCMRLSWVCESTLSRNNISVKKKIVELVRKEEKTSTEMKWSTKNSTQSDAVLLSLFFLPLYTLFFWPYSGCKSISARRWYHKLAAKILCGIFTELKTQPLEWAHGIEIEALW